MNKHHLGGQIIPVVVLWCRFSYYLLDYSPLLPRNDFGWQYQPLPHEAHTVNCDGSHTFPSIWAGHHGPHPAWASSPVVAAAAPAERHTAASGQSQADPAQSGSGHSPVAGPPGDGIRYTEGPPFWPLPRVLLLEHHQYQTHSIPNFMTSLMDGQPIFGTDSQMECRPTDEWISDNGHWNWQRLVLQETDFWFFNSKSSQRICFTQSLLLSEGNKGLIFTGDARDAVSIPELGRFPGEGNGNSFQYSCLGDPMDRGAWWAMTHGVTVGHD